MHDPISSAFDPQHTPALRLGGSHGYRIEGDVASINAELSFAGEHRATAVQHWALQLWACEEPYGGGALSGIKVAEAPIELPPDGQAAGPQLDAVAFAHLPASSRDYSMVLVLAAGQPGAFDQVHDFANYPRASASSDRTSKAAWATGCCPKASWRCARSACATRAWRTT